MFSNFDDLSGKFMAHHRTAREIAPASCWINTFGPVQVGAADAAGLDLEYQVIGSRHRVRNLLYDEWCPGLLIDCCFHDGLRITVQLYDIAV